MSRPRVKSKTGCLTCRTRRKKCDEVAPACGHCRRLKLHCRWRGSNTEQASDTRDQNGAEYGNSPILKHHTVEATDAVPTHSTSIDPVPPRTIVPAVSPGYEQPRNNYELVLLERGRDMILARADPLAGDTGPGPLPIVTAAVHEPCFRDKSAFNACTGLITSNESEPDRYSLALYSCAVRRVQDKINQRNELQTNMITILLSICCLGNLEAHFFGDAVQTMNHFLGAWTLLRLSILPRDIQRGSYNLPLYRFLTTSLMYNVAVHALFTDLRRFRKFPSTFRRKWLEIIFTSPAEPKSLASIHLAGQLETFHLTYEISYTGRNTLSQPSSVRREKAITDIEVRLNKMEQELEVLYSGIEDCTLRQVVTLLLKLHTGAVRLYLYKIKDPSACGSSASIKETLDRSIVLLQEFGLDSPLFIAVCVGLFWPLCIYMCAASDPGDISTLDIVVERAKLGMTWGHRRLIQHMRQKVGSARVDSAAMCGRKGEHERSIEQGNCTAKHDALNLLLQPAGLS